MPSAASAKLEKQASNNQETSENNANTPIRQALVIIEHKIRNLEKRKTKLESYRSIQASGKELSSDQKTAVAKYDEVTQSLEFARDLSKQLLQIAISSEKDQKKQLRKEALLRAQAETAKIREVLTIQNILVQFTQSEVRADFLSGCNNAPKLEEVDLTLLDTFYNDIQVKRQSQPEDVPFSFGAQKAAEMLSFTIDNRPKQYGESTFDNIHRILKIVQDSGYFDQAGKAIMSEETEEEIVEHIANADMEESQVQESEGTEENSTPIQEVVENSENEIVIDNPNMAAPTAIIAVPDVAKFQSEAPCATVVPAPAFPQTTQQQQVITGTQICSQSPPQLQRQLVPPPNAHIVRVPVPPVPPLVASSAQANAILPAPFPPTTVRAVEQAYFKQHQYIQQMRPIDEVISSGSFFFLQESELDSPDIVPSGYTPNDPANPTPPANAGSVRPQSPGSPANIQAQVVVTQQIQISQPGIPIKAQQPQVNPPIPTQTFTNQSFPNIVPPAAIFPPQPGQNPEIQNSPPQMPVFSATQMAIPTIVAQPAAVSPSSGQVMPIVENVPSIVALPPAGQPANAGNIVIVPGAVPLPGFSKFSSPTPIGIQQVSGVNVVQVQTKDKVEQVPPSQVLTEVPVQQNVEEIKERQPNVENTNEWDTNENNQRPVTIHHEEEANQWNNEATSNNNKAPANEWNSGFENQGDSSNWNNNQNDNYSGRNNSRGGGFAANNRSGGGGNNSGRGGRNNNGAVSNNYRGRSNNSYQQQNGRPSGVYFRNNENNYYQNQNGTNYNNGKQEGVGNFGGNGNNVFRSRGGMVPPSNRQQQNCGRIGQTGNNSNTAPRNNVNSNRNNVGMSNSSRPGRSNTGNTGNYGGSRPPNNVRQSHQQDINA